MAVALLHGALRPSRVPRELLQGGPNSAYYVTEDERFRPTMSQTRTPEWQMAKTSLAAQRRGLRRGSAGKDERHAGTGDVADSLCAEHF